MANERARIYVGSKSAFEIATNIADDKVWNDVDSAWETYSAGNIGEYDLPLSGSGLVPNLVTGDFPTNIAVGTQVRLIAYEQQGASPAVGDLEFPIGEIRIVYWTGTGLAASAPPVSSNSILGHWNQNSIGNITQADAYFANRVEATDWSDATSPSKETFLKTATSALLRNIPLGGAPMFRHGIDDDGTIITDEESPPFYQKFDPAFSLPKTEYATGLRHKYETGTADSGSTTTLVDAALAAQYQDDVWIYGSILLTARDPRVMVEITDYDATTGTFTFAAIGSAVDSTDTYIAVFPLPSDIYRGVFEQALYVAGGNYDQRANLSAQGVASMSQPGINEQYQTGGQRTIAKWICPQAEEAWRPYRAKATLG